MGALLPWGCSKNNVYEWSIKDASTERIKRACIGVKRSLNFYTKLPSQNNLSVSSMHNTLSEDLSK